MIARRYTVRLYWRRSMKAQQDVNLDPKSDRVLRALLEDLVAQVRGNLRCDLSEWKVVVHALGGGRIHATCTVTSDGFTKVTR